MFLGVLIPTATSFIIYCIVSGVQHAGCTATAVLLDRFRVLVASAVVFRFLGFLYQHSSVINNNVNMSSIKTITNTPSSFPFLQCPHVVPLPAISPYIRVVEGSRWTGMAVDMVVLLLWTSAMVLLLRMVGV